MWLTAKDDCNVGPEDACTGRPGAQKVVRGVDRQDDPNRPQQCERISEWLGGACDLQRALLQIRRSF